MCGLLTGVLHWNTVFLVRLTNSKVETGRREELTFSGFVLCAALAFSSGYMCMRTYHVCTCNFSAFRYNKESAMLFKSAKTVWLLANIVLKF